MTLHFSLTFNDLIHPYPNLTEGGVYYTGPVGLVNILESLLGLTGHSNNIEHIRTEHYRQVLTQLIQLEEDLFYQKSFQADQLATSERLLQMRDELLLAGWSGEILPDMPERLGVFARLELLLQKESKIPFGFADRVRSLIFKLENPVTDIKRIQVEYPCELLPAYIKKIFTLLEKGGAAIVYHKADYQPSTGDLEAFRQNLFFPSAVPKKRQAQADGSLLIMKSKRETDAAAFLAGVLHKNPFYQPLFIIPEKNRVLDNAFIQEGLPSLGILSASSARPTLQMLKLVSAFLWKPVDPYKILEFVTLPIKPLDDELATIIAGLISQAPGIQSEKWYAEILRYFDELSEAAVKDPSINVAAIRREYNFWFERNRYDADKVVPKSEAAELFQYLCDWARRQTDSNSQRSASLIVLSEQAKRIHELLNALPPRETHLTQLELERIIRTVYEPSPVMFRERESGGCAFVYQPGAIFGPVESLVWWNFINNEPDIPVANWYPEEIEYLNQAGAMPDLPSLENERKNWARKQALWHNTQKLCLVIPELIDGNKVSEHPLYADLLAGFENLSAITFQLDATEDIERFSAFFEPPLFVDLPSRLPGNPEPFLVLPSGAFLGKREQETFTSLESLFYFPHQWVFRYIARLKKSAVLQVTKDKTLLGNLAHRIFEQLLQEPFETWSQNELSDWIERQGNTILSREGTVLLLYGKEPERHSFFKIVKNAAWGLINLIRNNGWKVLKTELLLEGQFLEVPLTGIADMVLERGNEKLVIDLKWSSKSYRESMIRSMEDLQLVMYSRLISGTNEWAHTAYYIIDKAQMIARNNRAFGEISAISPDSDHQEIHQTIWQKMEATYLWRMEQLSNGNIEIRTNQTAGELEEHYYPLPPDILEMRKEEARFDDYRTLIHMIN